MAKDKTELVIPAPTKQLTVGDLRSKKIGESPKLSDRAPGGNWMQRGTVSCSHATQFSSNVAPTTAKTVANRGSADAIPSGHKFTPALPVSEMVEHPFGDSAPSQ